MTSNSASLLLRISLMTEKNGQRKSTKSHCETQRRTRTTSEEEKEEEEKKQEQEQEQEPEKQGEQKKTRTRIDVGKVSLQQRRRGKL